MKIGIIGCGAVGGYYGAMLCRAGVEVHCLLRSDLEPVRANGLRITSPAGDFTVHPHGHDSPGAMGECDLILVALKTTANHRLEELVSPLVGPHSAILCLQNGLGNCEQLAALFGAENILGGLCFVCINRTAPGAIEHLAFGKIIMGEHTRPPAERTHALAALFKNAGVPCSVADNLEHGLWEKLVWNIPFNGLGVAAAAGWEALQGGPIANPPGAPWPTDRLLADRLGEEWVRGVMLEIIAAANAKGLELKPELAETMIERTRAMGAYRASTLIDFESGRLMEIESMFLEPLRQAQATGVPVPRLEALCVVLRNLTGYRPRQ